MYLCMYVHSLSRSLLVCRPFETPHGRYPTCVEVRFVAYYIHTEHAYIHTYMIRDDNLQP